MNTANINTNAYNAAVNSMQGMNAASANAVNPANINNYGAIYRNTATANNAAQGVNMANAAPYNGVYSAAGARTNTGTAGTIHR